MQGTAVNTVYRLMSYKVNVAEIRSSLIDCPLYYMLYIYSLKVFR